MKTKIDLIVFALVIFVLSIMLVLNKAFTWSDYSQPGIVNGVLLGRYKAADYKEDKHRTYYFAVKADVKYTRGIWPFVNEEILKCDTILMIHDDLND